MKPTIEITEQFAKDRFATCNGAVIEEVWERGALCSLRITPDHRNAMGAVMGGVYYMLADFAFAVAANWQHMDTVSLSSDIAFLGAAGGDKLIAAAECVRSVVRGALNENLSAVGKDWRGMGYIADGAAAVDLYGNAALAGALEETVMSVRGNRVSLLPCDLCPDADKEIKNLRRGEFSLWLSYSAKNQTLKATVRRVTEGAAEIVLPAGVKKNVRTNRGVYDQNGRVNVTLRKGEYCEINCKYAPPSR